MTPVTQLAVGDTVIWLGKTRLITKIDPWDADGLFTVHFQDRRWLHCAPDQLLQKVDP